METEIKSPASMWYGFLSIITGILGVLLTIRGAITEPRNGLFFILGLITFGAAFLLKILELTYK